MLIKLRSDTRPFILVTSISSNSYTVTTEVTTTKSYLGFLLLNVTNQTSSLDLLSLHMHSMELKIWLKNNLNGGLNRSKLEMVSGDRKKQMHARSKFVPAQDLCYL